MDHKDLTATELAAAVWRKSSHSGNGGGNCVEVATNIPGIVAVRDSKDRGGPALTFTPGEWRAFLDGAKDGEFDQLG